MKLLSGLDILNIDSEVLYLYDNCGIHTGCAKNVLSCFCHHFTKSLPNLIIFGIQLARTMELC